MHPVSSPDVTRLLEDVSAGNENALERLIPVVYAELRRQAARYLRRERPDHTLQPTALVNEAFLRLVDQRNVRWQNRAHFFGVAAQSMRRILVDHARTRQRIKRGGVQQRVTLVDSAAATAESVVDLLALDQSLARLEALDSRQSRIVELRFFAGLSVEETAEILEISPATVKREWSMAKAWLHSQLKSQDRS
jgi:RNA polymerase sigma factor (TIGR02999 family)